MKKIKLICVTLLSASLFFVSCSKSAPQGLTGDTGATGSTGVTGGDSVLYSGLITMEFTEETDTNNNTYLVDVLSVPALTSTTLVNSVVLGYVYFPTGFGDSVWISDYYTTNFELYQIPQVGALGLISEGAWFPNGTYTNDLSGLKFRYIIVPGKVEVSNANGGTTTITAEEAKKMSYSALASALGVSIPATGSGSIGLRSN